jgi:hypothetical protein
MIMKKVLIFLVFVFSVFASYSQNFKDGKVDFISVQKVPIVKGMLNGKEAYFIIDSGASVSILDENGSSHYDFLIGESEEDIVGYGGISSPKETNNVDVEVGGVDFNGEYQSQDIANIVGAVLSNGGITISGIIGSNVMKKVGLVIDFGSRSLYIRNL